MFISLISQASGDKWREKLGKRHPLTCTFQKRWQGPWAGGFWLFPDSDKG